MSHWLRKEFTLLKHNTIASHNVKQPINDEQPSSSLQRMIRLFPVNINIKLWFIVPGPVSWNSLFPTLEASALKCGQFRQRPKNISVLTDPLAHAAVTTG